LIVSGSRRKRMQAGVARSAKASPFCPIRLPTGQYPSARRQLWQDLAVHLADVAVLIASAKGVRPRPASPRACGYGNCPVAMA
jgi:hypothetical protein